MHNCLFSDHLSQLPPIAMRWEMNFVMQITLSIPAFLFNSINGRQLTGNKDRWEVEIGIRNNAGWWKRFKHFYPEIGLAAEILGVLIMMLVLTIEL